MQGKDLVSAGIGRLFSISLYYRRIGLMCHIGTRLAQQDRHRLRSNGSAPGRGRGRRLVHRPCRGDYVDRHVGELLRGSPVTAVAHCRADWIRHRKEAAKHGAVLLAYGPFLGYKKGCDMPKSQDNLTKVLDSVGSVRQAFTQNWRRTGTAGLVYARAQLRRAEINEDYFVKQDISANHWAEMDKEYPPAGRIVLAMPYDGFTYFTRQAQDDVAKSAALPPGGGEKAIIGHLLLQDYGETTLRTILPLTDRYGSLAIEVPIGADGVGGDPATGDGDPDDLGHLIADRRTWTPAIGYRPGNPTELPAHLEVHVFDPDSFDLPELDLLTSEGQPQAGTDSRTLIDKVVGKIRQQAGFANHLTLAFRVQLNLPAKGDAPAKARLFRMSIGWPTITSLRTLTLHVGDGEKAVRYDPFHNCLEWEGIDMQRDRKAEGDSDTRVYLSPLMLLNIQHPGELYRQPTLEMRAEVEVSGYLLSGVTARLYDATGHPYPDNRQPTLLTRVKVTAELMLNDAFAKRDFSPYQQLFFGEIIPDEMRITDIETALKDRGFELTWREKHEPPSHPNNPERKVNWGLEARRPKGPDTMKLWIFVEGTHLQTEREIADPSGRVVHKATLQSGELRIFIRGTLPRNSEELTHEMNTLRGVLQERYDRVRSRR